MDDRKIRKRTLLLIILLIVTIFFSIFIGRYSISPIELLKEIFKFDAMSEAVKTLLKLRSLRIFAAVCVGGALAVSGATFQGVFRNPLVSPDLLGAASGAGLGACIAIVFNASNIVIQISAFTLGLFATFLCIFLSNRLMKWKSGTLIYILIGLVISSVFQAGISITKYVADPYNSLETITFWLMGSLAKVEVEQVVIIAILLIIGFIPLYRYSWQINLLSFKEDEAMAMGINVKRVRTILIFAATLLCSASVAISGIIGWVGLVIPHFARIIIGPNNKNLIPISFLVGAIFLLIMDNASRSLLATEIPIGILTSIVGAPIFIILLLRGKNGWN